MPNGSNQNCETKYRRTTEYPEGNITLIVKTATGLVSKESKKNKS